MNDERFFENRNHFETSGIFQNLSTGRNKTDLTNELSIEKML